MMLYPSTLSGTVWYLLEIIIIFFYKTEPCAFIPESKPFCMWWKPQFVTFPLTVFSSCGSCFGVCVILSGVWESHCLWRVYTFICPALSWFTLTTASSELSESYSHSLKKKEKVIFAVNPPVEPDSDVLCNRIELPHCPLVRWLQSLHVASACPRLVWWAVLLVSAWAWVGDCCCWYWSHRLRSFSYCWRTRMVLHTLYFFFKLNDEVIQFILTGLKLLTIFLL